MSVRFSMNMLSFHIFANDQFANINILNLCLSCVHEQLDCIPDETKGFRCSMVQMKALLGKLVVRNLQPPEAPWKILWQRQMGDVVAKTWWKLAK